MAERIISIAIIGFLCSAMTAYMYYTTIQPQLDEIKKLLKKDEEEE